jgi:hypothetical protein
MSMFSGKGSIQERKYRLKQMADLIPAAKGYNFDIMQPAVFAQIEANLLKQAREASKTCGRLFESSIRDDGGRKITSYEGDINAFLKPFKAPGMVCTINKNAGTHEETVRVRDGQRVTVS